MKNNQYWSNRSKERMMQYHKNSNNTINIIHKAYDKAIKDIEKDIKNIHDNLAINGQLSLEDTKQLLNTKVPKKEMEELRRMILNIDDADTKKYLLARLNTTAYKARMTRLEHLKESVYIRSKQLADVEIQASTSQYINTINNVYNRTMFDIQKGIGMGFDFATMNDGAVKAILNNPWSGKHFINRIRDNGDVIAGQLTEVLTSGFMTGKSIDKMARELRDRAHVGKYVATRLIRTETTYMANAAEIESYKECGIEKYIYIATLDLRTSKDCRKLDREILEVSKAMAGENLPPMHPNCRSTTRSYISKEELAKIKRRARDPITGKTYLVPGDMNYKEWYETYLKE